MNSQMIKEIMPLSEDLAASLMSTREQPDDPSRIGSLMLKNHILFGIRLVFVDPYL